MNVVVSPTDDPFASAAQVRVTVSGGGTVKMFPVTGGHFDIKLDQKPSMESQTILVEALDGAGTAIAYGQTGPVLLAPQDQTYAVWVGRPGKIAQAPAKLPSPRAEMASAALTSLGALYAGGRDANGNALSDAVIYDTAEQIVIPVAPMASARAGAAPIVLSSLRGAVLGGAVQPGFGNAGAPLATGELFDPTAGSAGNGTWFPLTGDASDARSQASATLLAGGSTLVAGGADGAGNPLASALLVAGDPSPRVALLPPMTSPRLGHAVAPTSFPDGAGALIFGGLAAGSTGANAERLVSNTFAAYALPGVTSRNGATATALANGNVLVLGGRDASGPLASGFVVQPTVPATVLSTVVMLSAARDGHTATLVGQDVLVCGGADASGAPIGSCDLLDGTTFVIKQTVPLAVARRGHAAQPLLTGIVVLAGGFIVGGAPTDSIEIYTPLR